jgi:prepilin-type N-terminal cleavage/methylation domain-containing protein
MRTSPQAISTWSAARGGFTLIELLVAAAIAGLLMMTAVPYVREVRKDPLVRAVTALVDACREARLQAILKDSPHQVVIYENGGAIGVEPVPRVDWGMDAGQGGLDGTGVEDTEDNERAPKRGFHATLDDEVAFRVLLVNGRDRMTESAVTIRFFPNGTCDALDAELQWLRHDARRVSLDILTGKLTVAGVQ